VSHAERVARAEHELRGAATALALVCEALRRDPAARHHGAAIEAQLDRLRAGLTDLQAARGTESTEGAVEEVELCALATAAARPWGETEIEWEGGPIVAEVDRGRFAQALGNVLANAAEHGLGPVRVIGRPHDGGVRLEVRNRGHGLQIAKRAAEELGGSLSFEIVGDSAVATLDLPAA
jgi:signal transduction histidine kinase